jgi:hypothetical protein
MQKGRMIAAIAVAVVVAGGAAIGGLTARLSGAVGQIDAAAELQGREANARSSTFPEAQVTAPQSAAPALSAVAELSAVSELSAVPEPAAQTSLPSPVDAFLAARADLERRAAVGPGQPNGAALSAADIAGLLARDPQFQSALLDLARDPDPEVRREATRFLAGVDGGGEPTVTE